MAIVLGLDSSTQSLSATILDTESGATVLEFSVNFGLDLPQYGSPNGFLPGGAEGEVHADPAMWLDALDLLLTAVRDSEFDLSQISAVSGAGQQHGSVYLSREFTDILAGLDPEKTLAEQIKPALTRASSPIWMDSSTTAECREIESAVGGPLEVCSRSGSIAIERFTGPQIRRFSKLAPEDYNRTAVIHLVSSFMASVLAGKSVAIDHGDGAGMNLMSLVAGEWDNVLLGATAPELHSKLPPLAPSGTVVGSIGEYFVKKYGFSPDCQCVLWTGDNPSSLVGMGAARPGKIVISLGTSDTLFAAMPTALTDPNGYGHVFGNPWGGFMSLVCFRNGSLAREALRDQLAVGWDSFEAVANPDSATDEVMLPFYEVEITPRTSRPLVTYSAEDSHNALQQIRLLLEGQFLNMKLQSQWMQLATDVIYVTGGASRNHGVCQVIADVFQTPLERLGTASSVSLGAAMRAAAAACGESKERLEEMFCKPLDDSRIEPTEDLAESMQEKLAKFEALLSAELGH